MFSHAKNIWPVKHEKKNSFVIFFDSFTTDKKQGNIILSLYAGSNFTVFINGIMAGTGQYPHLPNKSFYEQLDISAHIKAGNNELKIIAYCVDTDKKKGLSYEVKAGKMSLCYSSNRTKFSITGIYGSGESPRLGNGFAYMPQIDLTKDERIELGDLTVEAVPKSLQKRPIKRLELSPPQPATTVMSGYYRLDKTEQPLSLRIQQAGLHQGLAPLIPLPIKNGYKFVAHAGEGIYILLDLSEECTGHFSIDIDVPQDTLIDAAFGEHLDDTRIRSYVGGRNFCFSIKAKKGRSSFTDYFTRLGLRYLSLFIHATEAVLYYAGIVPVYYPEKQNEVNISGYLERRIYDVAIHTLRCCKHDHYEDCPWREQMQYTMDSHIQMLCGYYAFDGSEFQRAAIVMMAGKILENGDLPLMQPEFSGMPIPCYSLVFVLIVEKYLEHTGDVSVLDDVYAVLNCIVESYVKRIDKSGLIKRSDTVWNFYEWNDGSINRWEDNPLKEGQTEYHMPLACFVVLALKALLQIQKIYGIATNDRYVELIKQTQRRVHEAFYDEEKGLYAAYITEGKRWHYSAYNQTLAILSDTSDSVLSDALSKKLEMDTSLIPVALFNKYYLYEAMLKVSKQNIAFVRQDILRTWTPMLEKGATTFWETEKGGHDFNLAGSLCHGWSALPVYIYHKYSAN